MTYMKIESIQNPDHHEAIGYFFRNRENFINPAIHAKKIPLISARRSGMLGFLRFF